MIKKTHFLVCITSEMICFFPSHLFVFLTGTEDPSHTKKNRPVLRNSRLCQKDPTEGRCHGLLQGLCTQLAGYCPLRWHRPGCLRGQRDMKAHSSYSIRLLSVHLLVALLIPPDSEVCLVEQEQRFSRPGGHGAGRLWCRLQHLWTAGKLPTGTDSHPNAGKG